MAKLLYTPVSLLISVLGAVAAGTVFKQIWKRISDEGGGAAAGQGVSSD